VRGEEKKKKNLGLGNPDYGAQEDRKFAGDDGYDTLENSLDKDKKK